MKLNHKNNFKMADKYKNYDEKINQIKKMTDFKIDT